MKGTELIRSETVDDARNLINAGRKNIMINGDMQVAQYGTTISVEGYACDRWNYLRSGINNELTFSQESVTSSDVGPWEAGFRNCLQIQNGDQTAGAGASDYAIARYKVEARDIANCGWDYTSPNSYITFSYWIKSSVGQNFYNYMRSHDGTAQVYTWETGILTKDVWKKVTVTFPGDSGLTFNDDNGIGMMITFPLFWGGTWTDPGVGLNKWREWNTNHRTPDWTTTWWNTNDATLSLTGVQLEVGSQATSFEHRFYGEELALCQRYYLKTVANTASYLPCTNASDHSRVNLMFPVTMRSAPQGVMTNYTLTCKTTGVNGYQSNGATDTQPEGTFNAEL